MAIARRAVDGHASGLQPGTGRVDVIDQEREDGPRSLHVYRPGPTRYEEIPHDADGRVLLPVLGLFIALRDDRVVCFDATTGEEIEDFSGQKRGREEAVDQLRQYKEEVEKTMTEQVEKAEKQRLVLVAAEERVRKLEEQLRLQAGAAPPAQP